jgi:hypothetical protein
MFLILWHLSSFYNQTFFTYIIFISEFMFQRISLVVNIYNLLRSGVRGSNRRETNELQPTGQLQNTRNSKVTFYFLVTYANQLYLFHLHGSVLQAICYHIYVYCLSGIGEKRETSTTQRQSSFAVNSNTGLFKISVGTAKVLPKMSYHRILLLVTVCSYFKGWIVERNGLVSFWTVYLSRRHQAGSELGSYTTQVWSQG